MSRIIDWLKKIFQWKRPETGELAKPEKKQKTRPRKKIRKKSRRKIVKSKIVKSKVKLKPRIKKIPEKPIVKKIPQKPVVKKRKLVVSTEFMKEVIVADIMTKNPIVVDTNDTLSYVMRLFADKNISGVPVVREENFVGVVSESDIIKLIGKKESPEERALGIKRLTVVKVSDVMHRSPVFVYEYTKLSDAADLMNKHDITRLIVLDDKKKIVGIVARSDIIRGVAKELLYRILKKKEDEKVRKIDTDIDEVLNIVERKGSIDIDEIKKKLMLPEDKIEEWGKILESHGLLELFYPAVGKPKLRKKIK